MDFISVRDKSEFKNAFDTLRDVANKRIKAIEQRNAQQFSPAYLNAASFFNDNPNDSFRFSRKNLDDREILTQFRILRNFVLDDTSNVSFYNKIVKRIKSTEKSESDFLDEHKALRGKLTGDFMRWAQSEAGIEALGRSRPTTNVVYDIANSVVSEVQVGQVSLSEAIDKILKKYLDGETDNEDLYFSTLWGSFENSDDFDDSPWDW